MLCGIQIQVFEFSISGVVFFASPLQPLVMMGMIASTYEDKVGIN
jgi:hypothetical protein